MSKILFNSSINKGTSKMSKENSKYYKVLAEMNAQIAFTELHSVLQIQNWLIPRG